MTVGSIKRRLAAVMVAAISIATVVSVPASAHHQPASGELDFVSDRGERIGTGGTYFYSSARRDRFQLGPTFKNGVFVSVSAANGDWWHLDIAPPEGQRLDPGRYDQAYRFPFEGPGAPGLSFSGNGRGCNRSLSSFTVEQISYWPDDGGLRDLAVRFEQQCDGAVPALRGRVRVSTSVPPPRLKIEVRQDPAATVSLRSGAATVSGTVRCNQDAKVDVGARIQQGIAGIAVDATGGREVACSTRATAWRATVSPYRLRYVPGRARSTAYANGRIEHYFEPAEASRSETVQLRSIP